MGRLAGAPPQTELADVVLDARRTPKVRTAAAAALLRHIQEHGLTLQATQIDSLAALYASAGDKDLKEEMALLMGGLRPNARLTGERLLKYQPTPPGAPLASPRSSGAARPAGAAPGAVPAGQELSEK